MAKTIFAALQEIPSIFLNKIFAHRHDGIDQDGSAPLDYAADSGAANAYVVTLSPVLTQYVIGMPIRFKAINANTGAATVNINGLGVTPIKKNVSVALSAGNILAGQIITVIYDGTNFQLKNKGIIGAADVGSVFGAYSSPLSEDVAWQATADGIVIAINTSSSGVLTCKTDVANPPTTLVGTADSGTTGSGETLTFPCRKGEYVLISNSTANSPTIYFIPLGV